MAAATVDALSGGRFVLGLGSSHRVQVEREHGLAVREADRAAAGERGSRPRAAARRRRSPIAARPSPSSASTSGSRRSAARSRSTCPRCSRPCWRRAGSSPRASSDVEHAWRHRRAPPRTWPRARAAPAAARRGGRDLAPPLRDRGEPRRRRSTRMRPCGGHVRGLLPALQPAARGGGLPRRRARHQGSLGCAATARPPRARCPTPWSSAVGVVGTAAECRARIEEYRAAGLTLPIISPRARGVGARTAFIDAVHACAP